MRSKKQKIIFVRPPPITKSNNVFDIQIQINVLKKRNVFIFLFKTTRIKFFSAFEIFFIIFWQQFKKYNYKYQIDPRTCHINMFLFYHFTHSSLIFFKAPWIVRNSVLQVFKCLWFFEKTTDFRIVFMRSLLVFVFSGKFQTCASHQAADTHISFERATHIHTVLPL